MRLSHLDRRGTMAGWPVSRSVSRSVSWPVGRSKKVGAIQVIRQRAAFVANAEGDETNVCGDVLSLHRFNSDRVSIVQWSQV